MLLKMYIISYGRHLFVYLNMSKCRIYVDFNVTMFRGSCVISTSWAKNVYL